jgi:hypothetical protein
MLNRASNGLSTPLQPGELQLPGKVTRYVDANPVDIQLDIPLLGQFRIYLFVPDVPSSLKFLTTLSEDLANLNGLEKRATGAKQSYIKKPLGLSPADEFISPQRYTTVSDVFTYAMVTQSARSDFEIADLPQLLQDSRWTLYLDMNATGRWFGKLEKEQVGVAIVRPDGYCGSIGTWGLEEAGQTRKWIEEYFEFMQ